MTDETFPILTTLTEQQVAALLGIEVKTLRNMRAAKRGPSFVKSTAGTTVYLPDDVTRYLLGKRIDLNVDQDAIPQAAAVKRGRGRPKKIEQLALRA